VKHTHALQTFTGARNSVATGGEHNHSKSGYGYSQSVGPKLEGDFKRRRPMMKYTLEEKMMKQKEA